MDNESLNSALVPKRHREVLRLDFCESPHKGAHTIGFTVGGSHVSNIIYHGDKSQVRALVARAVAILDLPLHEVLEKALDYGGGQLTAKAVVAWRVRNG